ncbi:monopolin-like complex subunit Mde4 [Schizosaccharomyces cryophilus OY26]|uniref:Monopolin-like complex subunit Mde4 n=1 Tax=Schizosaccharomyces cryophilus (strain OY26 / ATCC MYA-4695 / CBS 11777 / NBRC 106824 / NRRL Y48691) TaxID=653667 RepID=S9X9N1_SCHCR|nr:monopolin-like complex subunit Mde4 [Schizosaccharomyces cryophilus OY26]EPY53852.1 monopolin-like complex subunit Mde4 [Schizosaccharomyces cryophilus OY26]
MNVEDLSKKHTNSLHQAENRLLQCQLELNFYLTKASNVIHGLQSHILRTTCLEATNHANKLLLQLNEGGQKSEENDRRASKLEEVNGSLTSDIVQLKSKISSLEANISQNLEDMSKLHKLNLENSGQEELPLMNADSEHAESKASYMSPDKTNLSSSNAEQVARLHRTITELKKSYKEKDSDLNKLHSALSAKESELNRWKIKLETEESNWKVRLQVLESKVATQGKKLRKNEVKRSKSTLITPGLTSSNTKSPLSPALRSPPKKSPLRVTPYLQRTSAIVGLPSSPSQASPTIRSGITTTTQTPNKDSSLIGSARKETDHNNIDSGNAEENPASSRRLSSLTPSKIPLPTRKKRKFETDNTTKFEELDESDTSMTMEVPLQTKVTLPRTISPPKARSESLVALKDKFKMKKGV